MIRGFLILLTSLLLVAVGPGCVGSHHGDSHSVNAAIDETMAEARRTVAELGVTEEAMQRIEVLLARLAAVPGLQGHGELREVHGGAVASAVLRSDGNDGLTLILARFQPGITTPIHDHGTWAVIHVLEGQERYKHWDRLDDGRDPQHAELEVKYERVLGPGDSVHWFQPPEDIHSQETLEQVTWELILFGRNPLHGTLQYFDPSTGQVTTKAPVAEGSENQER